jgi:hypothetical protein
MNRRVGKVLAAFVCGTVVLAGILFITCGPTSPSSSGPTVSTTPLNDLIVIDQIAGWGIDTSVNNTAMPFTDSTSGPNFVDGGNSDYCGLCNGTGPLKNGIGTYFMALQNNHKIRSFVLDYGTAAAAKKKFDAWVANNSTSKSEAIGSFPNTTAIGFDFGGGMSVFAHFINFFVELRFNNYDSSSLAIPDASAFLNYYNSKIK